MSLRLLWSIWQKFWFEPESPIPLALFRILFGLVLLEWCVLTGPELLNCYGANGIVRIKTLELTGPWPALDVIAMLPPGDGWVMAVFATLVIAGICLTLGLFSRVSMIIIYVLLVSFVHRNTMVNHSGVKLMTLAAFYLMFAPLGAALSLDRLRRIWQQTALPPRKPSPCAAWAVRAFQFQWVLLYAQTFWSKFDSPMWLDGTAIYYVLRSREFWRFPVPFVPDSQWLCIAASWGTMAAECLAWTLIYFRETRYLVLWALLFLHLGIEYSMNIPIFEHIMIICLVLFVYPQDLTKVMDMIKAKVTKLFGPPAILTYNGALPQHLKLARTIESLDILGRIATADISVEENRASLPHLPEESNQKLMLLHKDQWLSSFEKARSICARLPLCWPLYPVLRLLS